MTGRTDFMDPDLLDLINEVPNDLRAAGFEPDLFFHEPGGRGGGLAPIEEFVVYLGPELASGLIGGAAWAAITTFTAWARKRILRERSSHVTPTPAQSNSQEPFPIYVLLRMYSGEGAFLSRTEITIDRVAHDYMHSAIKKGESSADFDSLVKIDPNERGQVAVTTATGSISCLIEPGRVSCETPAASWPRHDNGTPFHSFRFHASGEIEWVDGQMGDTPRMTLTPGGKYRAFEWEIRALEDGLALINDYTGRGVRVTPEGVEGF